MAVARSSFCLLVAVQLMTFSQSSLGLTFQFNGFKSKSELFIVTESNWVYNLVNESCYSLTYPPDNSVGRLLYPQAVSMRDPGRSAVKSFSTTFIFQIYKKPGIIGRGSGLTFLMVPNNVTIGAPYGFLGLITTTTDTVTRDVASDEHTFGVEFDTVQNAAFDDENDNHIGLDFASMNSTFSFKPTINLVTITNTVYHQVWIDYSQAQSTMDIYLAMYQPWVVKPAVPSVSWTSVDLSLLSEPTFIGFSAALGSTGVDRHSIFAWSFSNEGEAPPISLAKDAPPSGPSPPGTRKSPPPRTPGVPYVESPGNSPTRNLGLSIGVPAAFASVFVFFGILWLWWVKRPVYIFLSHRNVENVKNFVSRLNDELVRKQWSSRLYRVKVFFDSEAVGQATQVATVILKELDRFDLGVVVVTRAFFESRWCMTELIAFKDAHDSGRYVSVWPLFYELRPEDVKQLLDDRVWESKWVEFSKLKSHPLDLGKCRESVRWLTTFRGPLHFAKNETDGERYYINTILQQMENILKETRSLKAARARVRRRPAPKKPHGGGTPLPSVV